MDRLSAKKGFLPGLFGGSDSTSAEKEKRANSKDSRSPMVRLIPSEYIRNHFVAMAGEFVGTL